MRQKIKRIVLLAFVSIMILYVCISCGSTETGELPGLRTFTAEELGSINNLPLEFFREQPLTCDFLDAVERYAESNPAMSQTFWDLYQRADRKTCLPVYGADLEYTSLVVCLFWNHETLVGTRTLQIEGGDPPSVVGELEVILGIDGKPVPFWSLPFCDQLAMEAIVNSMQADPSFDLCGMIYTASEIRPLGLTADDPYLKYYGWLDESKLDGYLTIRGFRWVEPFKSVEEGQRLLAEYEEFRAGVLSSLPLYEWDSVFLEDLTALPTLYFDGWLVPEVSEEWLRVYYDADWIIGIPLLNHKGEEEQYVYYLFFYRDQLIYEGLWDLAQGSRKAITERYSDRDWVTGEYSGLAGIEFLNEMKKTPRKGMKNEEIVGIGYNGKRYFFVKNK